MSVAVAGTLRMAEWFFNPAFRQGPSCRSKDLHLPSFAPIALSLHRSSTETHLTLLRVLIVVNGDPDIKISPQDIEFRVYFPAQCNLVELLFHGSVEMLHILAQPDHRFWIKVITHRNQDTAVAVIPRAQPG